MTDGRPLGLHSNSGWLILAVALVLVLLASCSIHALAQEQLSARQTFSGMDRFDPKRDAAKDIEQAVAEAKRSGRRVLLDVGGEWCIWCRRLDTLFMREKELADFMHRNYVAVKVNYSKENKNEMVLSRYPKIPGYPHYFVLDAEGKLLHSQETGALEEGKGHSAKRVREFLKKWAPQTSE